MGFNSEKFASRFAERMEATSGLRADLRITDAVDLRDGSYKIAISYDKNLQSPTLKAVRQYIKNTLGGTVRPNMATACDHTGGRHHGITVVVTAQKHTLPYAARKNLAVVVAGTVFMDTKLKENWHVRTNENGKRILQCAREEDVAGLLQQAVTASTRNASGLKIGQETTAGAAIPEKGDVIKFFAANAQRTGTVTRIKGDDVSVAEEDGNTYIIPSASVIRTVQKNPKAAQEELNENAAFYATFHGKEFAKLMFPGAKI